MSINQPFDAARLAEFPVENGFRLRGSEMTRIEVLTDTAFAFAVTMLVISINDLPSNFDELAASLKKLPALIASFMQVMLFWQAHVLWSRRFGLEDGRTIWLSGGLIFVMLVFVYLLRLMFSSAFAWFSNGWLPSEIAITSFDDVSSMFLMYGSGFFLLSLFLAALNLHALTLREQLSLNDVEIFSTRTELMFQFTLAGTAVVSMLIAVLADAGWQQSIAGMIYGTLGISMPLIGIRRGKMLKQLLAETEASAADAA